MGERGDRRDWNGNYPADIENSRGRSSVSDGSSRRRDEPIRYSSGGLQPTYQGSRGAFELRATGQFSTSPRERDMYGALVRHGEEARNAYADVYETQPNNWRNTPSSTLAVGGISNSDRMEVSTTYRQPKRSPRPGQREQPVEMYRAAPFGGSPSYHRTGGNCTEQGSLRSHFEAGRVPGQSSHQNAESTLDTLRLGRAKSLTINANDTRAMPACAARPGEKPGCQETLPHFHVRDRASGVNRQESEN